jgi:hypothetical protein
LEKGTEAAQYFDHVGYLRSVLCPQEGIQTIYICSVSGCIISIN